MLYINTVHCILHMYMCVHMLICMYVCLSVRIYVCVYVFCLSVCLSVCMYVCMYVCVLGMADVATCMAHFATHGCRDPFARRLPPAGVKPWLGPKDYEPKRSLVG